MVSGYSDVDTPPRLCSVFGELEDRQLSDEVALIRGFDLIGWEKNSKVGNPLSDTLCISISPEK